MYTKDLSVRDRLFMRGYRVTRRKFGGWSGKTLIVDSKGREVGYYQPLEAIAELCKEQLKIEEGTK